VRLRKSSAPQRDPSERPHAGHVAAFGAKLAMLLSREGIRHTALTPDHVIWCKELNTLKALGWSHVETLTWPNDARQHLQDIRVFLQSCGTESTSALRLGYSFQLGPVAEWIFFDLLDSTTPEVSEPVPPFLLEQWTSPSRNLALKDDSTLSKKGESRCFEQVRRPSTEAVPGRKAILPPLSSRGACFWGYQTSERGPLQFRRRPQQRAPLDPRLWPRCYCGSILIG
jgi:hypothetical protein